MTTSLATIRDGLQTRLATISGLRAYDLVQGQPNVPCAMVRPADVDYASTFEGSADWTLHVEVYVSTASMRAAQNLMDTYWDSGAATSIYKAVDGDVDLGGTVQSASVTNGSDYGLIEYGGITYLFSRFTVQVQT